MFDHLKERMCKSRIDVMHHHCCHTQMKSCPMKYKDCHFSIENTGIPDPLRVKSKGFLIQDKFRFHTQFCYLLALVPFSSSIIVNVKLSIKSSKVATTECSPIFFAT